MKNQIEVHKQETANAKRLYNGENENTVKPLNDSPELLARKRLMVWLWAKMGHLFGGIWEATYGKVTDSAIKSWMDGLGPYTEQEVRGGMEQCQNWDGKFPPTFPEFRALVMAARSAQRSQSEAKAAWDANQGEVKQLSDFTKRKKTDGPVAIREKARIARILNGEEVETREESMTKLGLHRRWGA